jgi:molecular chaperone GrpE
MTADRKDKHFRIPIKFMDADPESENEVFSADNDEEIPLDEFAGETDEAESETFGGPDTAELIATRSELKRVEGENAELKNQLARRQADFENYRKRVDKERSETYNRVAADLAAKLLPVSDNLKRALEAESSVEAAESDEFRHFLSGVDLIWKQLTGVLDALGVKPIPSVGEPFNPHVHEAVVSEATDEYEPDTVIQEILTGYRLGDKLIRPSLVKVATRK